MCCCFLRRLLGPQGESSHLPNLQGVPQVRVQPVRRTVLRAVRCCSAGHQCRRPFSGVCPGDLCPLRRRRPTGISGTDGSTRRSHLQVTLSVHTKPASCAISLHADRAPDLPSCSIASFITSFYRWGDQWSVVGQSVDRAVISAMTCSGTYANSRSDYKAILTPTL